MFYLAILVIFLVSFLLAVWSLRGELKRPREIKIVKNELQKEKVLFRKD